MNINYRKMFGNNELTYDEKIDYIYKNIKSQKRNNNIKLVLKLTIIGFIAYFILILLPNLKEEEISSFIEKRVTSVILPIIQPITNKLISDTLKDLPNLK